MGASTGRLDIGSMGLEEIGLVACEWDGEESKEDGYISVSPRKWVRSYILNTGQLLYNYKDPTHKH